ncbi:hypothetical protein T4C_193 [Trichinella pseudospiralis]|uniref:Uncharacterized protein n=1 Tax=Trichinella pseudospiralis TaxID=6337 RepID=A0A0V1JT28_TRIPS|nr:hypothetical protein T4D_11141 [Trichinella pseudospiralis]KRZ38121.1 hypothetical protein T4C_193 [Trichinella pseudospiralis]
MLHDICRGIVSISSTSNSFIYKYLCIYVDVSRNRNKNLKLTVMLVCLSYIETGRKAIIYGNLIEEIVENVVVQNLCWTINLLFSLIVRQ